jgi:hypothetical protein
MLEHNKVNYGEMQQRPGRLSTLPSLPVWRISVSIGRIDTQVYSVCKDARAYKKALAVLIAKLASHQEQEAKLRVIA